MTNLLSEKSPLEPEATVPVKFEAIKRGMDGTAKFCDRDRRTTSLIYYVYPAFWFGSDFLSHHRYDITLLGSPVTDDPARHDPLSQWQSTGFEGD